MHEVLVNRLGGLSLPRKSVVRLTDCPDMTLDVYRGHKTTTQQVLLVKEQLKANHYEIRFRLQVWCSNVACYADIEFYT